MESQSSSQAQPGSEAPRALGVLWPAAIAALGLFAYRDLLSFQARTTIPLELQRWLLMPSETSTMVVLLLAGWLLFRRWPRLRALPRPGGPVWLTALLLLGGFSLFGWATYTGASDLLIFSLMLNALGFGNLIWGPPGLRVLALPVAFLVFAVPMPTALLNSVVFRFQLWTSDLAGLVLYLLGIPAFVSGDQILREAESFTIVEGCSGVRSVETLTMLAVLMIDLFRRRGAHAALLLLLAPAIAFGLNAVRVVFLMLNPLSETVAIHNLQGIAILLGGVVALYGLDGLLAQLLPERPAVAGRGAGAPSSRLSRARALGATGALAAASALSVWLPVWQPQPGIVPPLHIPKKIDGWHSAALETDYAVFLGRVGFGQRLQRTYVRGRDAVELFVGVGDHADRLRGPISPKTLRPGSGWIVEEGGTVALPPVDREVDYRVLRSGTRRALVYHWREGTKGLTDEVFRWLLALDRSPLRRPRDAVVIRLSTELGSPSGANRRAAERRLESFSETIGPSLAPLGTTGKGFPAFPDLGKPFPPDGSASTFKIQ